MSQERSTLGKYHLLERLSGDEIAELFKVKTIGIAGFEKVQVLKRILPRWTDNPHFIRSFIDQAKVAFSLNHRNIVQVFEFGKVDGELFLAMEYIPGANLLELIQVARGKGVTCPVGLACYLMGEVAAGLDYAHRKADHFGNDLGVIHADIHPANIACSFEGSVKLLDFGVSLAVWEMVARGDLTRRDIRYCSPEHLSGEPLGPAADIFSFGVILWELLTGRSLFGAPTREQVRKNVLGAVIPTPQAHNPDVPAPLGQLTLHCLSRDPERRMAVAGDLQMELHRIQRELGAVIGSRALSTHIEDLLPGHTDTRDVRQQDATVAQDSAAPGRFSRTDDLVNAASELAQPPNPPAHSVGAARARRRATAPASSTSLDGDAELAGVLRSGRLLDAEVVPTMRGSAKAGGRRTVNLRDAAPHAPQPSPSQHATVDHGPPADPLAPTALDHDSLPQTDALHALLEGPEEEETTATAVDALADSRNEPTRQAKPPRRPPSPAPADARPPAAVDQAERDRRSTQPAAPARLLGEKKRFIACAVVLDAADDGLRGDATRLAADIAYKLDGIVHDGDNDEAIVALFGIPAADENDVLFAGRYAIDLHEALAGLEGAHHGRVSARMGIRAGTARIGGLPSREGFQILGNSLAEAHALARHAASGQTCVAGVALRLASAHFVLAAVSPLRRHGKQIRCHRIVRPLPRGSRAHKPAEAAFVAREVELRALRTAHRESVLGAQQGAMLILGDAGVGKSRLAQELVHDKGMDSSVITAWATPSSHTRPHALLLDLVRAAASVGSGRGPQSRHRVAQSLRDLLARDDPHALQVLEKLTMPTVTAATTEGGGYGALALARAIHALLARLAEQRHVIVLLEDLHWADSASLDCLAHLLEGEQSAGAVFFLMTARPDDGFDPKERFHTGCPFLILDELEGTERQSLIRTVLGQRATDALVQEVERRAGGNPLYIRELAHALDEMNATGPVDVPATVRGVVAGRVDRLPAPLKGVLQHAAVIGPSFREGILAQVMGRNPARHLGALRNRGLIVSGLRAAVPSIVTAGADAMSDQFEREWAFRHLVFQEAVYDALSSAARRRLHQAVADIMQRRIRRGFSDPEADLARHLELAGHPQEACSAYLTAADQAAAAFAGKEALALYDKAARLSGGAADTEYAVLAGRERVHALLGMVEEQAADLEALRRFAEAAPARRADLRNREALHLLRRGHTYRALSAAQEAQQAAEDAGDAGAAAEALLLRCEAYGRLSDHQRAIDAAAKARAIFEQRDAVPGQVKARIETGRIHLLQARYDDAFSEFEPALALIRQSDDRWLERLLRYNLAVVHYCRGELPQALEDARDSLRICERLGDRSREGDCHSVLGIINLELGLLPQAQQHLRKALAIHREAGSQWSEADTLVYVGLAQGFKRQWQPALLALEQASKMAAKMKARYIAINADNAISWVLCERAGPGDAALAEQHATSAAEAARQVRLITGEIPGLSRSARAAAQQGNLQAAHALSRRAVELLEEQRTIESSEEEIYYTHHRILRQLGDEAAPRYLELSHQGLQRKLERLQDAEQRAAFSEGVRLNAAILADVAHRGETPPAGGNRTESGG